MEDEKVSGNNSKSKMVRRAQREKAEQDGKRKGV